VHLRPMTPGRPYGLDVLVLIPGVVPLEPIPFRGIWMGVYPAVQLTTNGRTIEMSILWTIIIGFIAGVIAKFIMPGDNEPSGFILTTILGIAGAFVASYLGQALGWYRPGEGAGLIGAVVGAIIVLFVYGLFAGRRRTAI
jgi:uncharacterized membrane protein YeaQ/YmgE (transglycosylase-associated protein family)